jgi:hypothetical protein
MVRVMTQASVVRMLLLLLLVWVVWVREPGRGHAIMLIVVLLLLVVVVGRGVVVAAVAHFHVGKHESSKNF